MNAEDNPRDETQFDREEYEAWEATQLDKVDIVTAKAAQCGNNDIERVAEASLDNLKPESELITNDVITGKHWLPQAETDFVDKGVDPRARLHLDIEGVTIEPAVVMDQEKPDPVKIIGAWWIHADCHGIMTPDIFYLDLMAGLSELATTIREDQDPFQPVRLYKEANNAYGVGYFDFLGDHYPFDLRVVVQFGTWQFLTDTKEPLTAAGFKFSIATLVLPTKDDHDVYVGHDWGRMFDDPNCMKKQS